MVEETDTGWQALLEREAGAASSELKKLKRWCEAGRSACATEMLPSSSTVPPPALTISVALTVRKSTTIKRVSQRVGAITPRLRKVESMTEIRIVRSLVERRLSLHTRLVDPVIVPHCVNCFSGKVGKRSVLTGITKVKRCDRRESKGPRLKHRPKP